MTMDRSSSRTITPFPTAFAAATRSGKGPRTVALPLLMRDAAATEAMAAAAAVAAGLVDFALRTDTGESVYRRCSDDHHHHLVCRICGSTVEIQGDHVENWASEVAKAHGYSDIHHTIEIFGVCRNCAVAASGN